MPQQPDLQQVLEKRFLLSEFRKGQKEVIESILNRKDALAVMPTGRGKSLCYQLPAIVSKGLVIVVSPLISLMEDQVRKLRALGIGAGYVHSGQTFSDKQNVFAEMKKSESFILYLSPERVQKDGFAKWIATQEISLFAIDESHCVSQWGPDFREDYYRLKFLREKRPDVPILALTASATPQVLKDIVKQLGLREPDKHIHGFYRPNLYYQVEHCDDDNQKFQRLVQGLKQTPTGRILIYCGTRKQSEHVASELKSKFGKSAFYHAGMTPEDRLRVQTDYEKSDVRILAATNAFGMGIDHPNVRLVVHYQMPANVENYYQEIGRAGRDNEHSTCLLLYSKKDKGLHSYFITQSTADAATIKRRWNALNTIVEFAEGGECRHAGILTYFKDSFRIKACGHCDICDPDSERKVRAPEKVFEISKPSASKKRKKKGEDEPLSSQEQIRYEMLREWRKNYAEKNDIPAFIVFSNKALRSLATKNPQTLDELRDVYGFGDHKVEHLGELVLEQLGNC